MVHVLEEGETSMHFNGIVFADDPRSLMNSLIHENGEPPAEVWLPLDVAGETGRSGWQTIVPDPEEAAYPWPFTVEDWVHCAWPTTFLRERLGPCAILGDEAIHSLGVDHRNVSRQHGQWQAKVPRFFTTIGDHWSMQRLPDRYVLVTTSGRICASTTVGDLALEATLKKAGPCLVVGPDGPVFYDEGFGPGKEDFESRRLEAAAPLMQLPSETLVSLVDWHG
jgi:hypothetical protein